MPPHPTVEILFEDNHCLAVNKPAGLLTQGDATGEPTLLDWARASLKARFQQAGERLRRARPPARPADVGGRPAREDEQGRIASLGAIPRGEGREGLPGDRRGDLPARVGDVDRHALEGRGEERRRGRREGDEGREGCGPRLPGARAPGRVDADRAPSRDGEGPSTPGPARVEGTTDRGGPQVRRLDHPDGGRRETPDCAACLPVDVHSPDAPGSDFGRCAGAGRLALARHLMGKPDRPQ